MEKLRKKTERSFESDRKVVDEKLPYPVGVLRRKANNLCVKLQLRGVGLKGEFEARKIEILIIEVLINGSVRTPRDFQAKGFYRVDYPHLVKMPKTK